MPEAPGTGLWRGASEAGWGLTGRQHRPDSAQRAIEEHAILRLSAEDQRRFAGALIQPPAPNAALKHAKRLHLETIEVR